MIGSQEPRIKIEPPRISSDGPEAALLMEAYASPLDPWEKRIVDCWLGKNADGQYTVTSAGLSVPRQNGKNVCLEGRELFGMVIRGERILHTAHQVVTAKKSFRRLSDIFTDRRHPEIVELVKNIRYTNGEESIELDNGGSIEYMTRSRQRARGFDGISLLVYDEAQELTDEQVEALMPTLSASATGTRQLIYTGSPPYPGCPGVVFRRRRNACLTDAGPHDAWHEWSVAADSAANISADDFGLWYMTNPGLGIHLTEAFVREELRSMSADGFARERLGWWAPVVDETADIAIPADKWQACRSGKPKPEGKTAYGIKFAADGSEVCLCGAVIPPEGPARISLIDRRPTGMGIQWLVEWLNKRYADACCVVIDGRNGVDILVERIRPTWRLKDSVIRSSARDVVAATGTLITAINEKTVTWYSRQEAMNVSALGTVKRPLAGGWAFGGDDSAPIEAAALALWGATTSKRDPKKRMRIG